MARDAATINPQSAMVKRNHQHGLDGRLNGNRNIDCWRYDWVLDLDIKGFSIDWAVEKVD